MCALLGRVVDVDCCTAENAAVVVVDYIVVPLLNDDAIKHKLSQCKYRHIATDIWLVCNVCFIINICTPRSGTPEQ